MNIAFFLIPKSELVCIELDSTMRQAVEKMEHHRYAAIPVVDEEGRYAGTLTEGDILWKLKNTPDITFHNMNHVPLKDVMLQRKNDPVVINANIEDLLLSATTQNFVPVTDDNGIFIGIVRRREIIAHCAKRLLETQEK